MLGGINFSLTIHNMRAKGMTWTVPAVPSGGGVSRLRSSCSHLPFLASGLAMNPAPSVRSYRLLRPGQRRERAAVRVRVLVRLTPCRVHHDPARVRIISEIAPVFSRVPIFRYKAMAAIHRGHCRARIHRVREPHVRHRITARRADVLRLHHHGAIGVPTGVQDLQRVARCGVAASNTTRPAPFACGFILMFLIQAALMGSSISAAWPCSIGLCMARTGSWHTFTMCCSAAASWACSRAVLSLVPEVTGRFSPMRSWGKLHFWLMLIGINLTPILPMYAGVGLLGMPRRIATYRITAAGETSTAHHLRRGFVSRHLGHRVHDQFRHQHACAEDSTPRSLGRQLLSGDVIAAPFAWNFDDEPEVLSRGLFVTSGSARKRAEQAALGAPA